MMSETQKRTTRDQTSREKEARTLWVPPSQLPEIVLEPGWSGRWIATEVAGQSHAQNVSMRMREGWEPVKAADHPEAQMFVGTNGNVEFGGLMFCKMETERLKAREHYFQQLTRTQMEAVDNNFMRNNDARMPLFSDKSSEVSRSAFGSGTK